MHVRAQIAVRRELQNFANVDDERAWNRLRIDPAALAFHLESGRGVLQQDADEAAILLRATPLPAPVRLIFSS